MCRWNVVSAQFASRIASFGTVSCSKIKSVSKQFFFIQSHSVLYPKTTFFNNPSNIALKIHGLIDSDGCFGLDSGAEAEAKTPALVPRPSTCWTRPSTCPTSTDCSQSIWKWSSSSASAPYSSSLFLWPPSLPCSTTSLKSESIPTSYLPRLVKEPIGPVFDISCFGLSFVSLTGMLNAE